MLQFLPSPWYPALHVQLYEPLVLLQKASELQLWVPLAHSSISEKRNIASQDFLSDRE